MLMLAQCFPLTVLSGLMIWFYVLENSAFFCAPLLNDSHRKLMISSNSIIRLMSVMLKAFTVRYEFICMSVCMNVCTHTHLFSDTQQEKGSFHQPFRPEFEEEILFVPYSELRQVLWKSQSSLPTENLAD